MSFDPIHRRYGYGAARVAMGVPADSTRLSEIAQRPSRFERSVTVVPVVLCTSIGLMLAAVSTIDRPVEVLPELASLPTVLDLTPWDEPKPRVEAVQRPVARPLPAADREAPPEPTRLADAPTEPRPTQVPQIEVEPSPPPFDLSQLAMAPALGVPGDDALSSGDRTRPAAPTRSPVRPKSSNAHAASALNQIARSLPAPSPLDASTATLTETLGTESDGSAATRTARPTDATSGGAPEALADFGQGIDRSAFLASVTGATREGPLAAQQQVRSADRPHVAAASAARETALEIRARVREQARADGWDEVPLDALPACSPPEREDALKKRILLASSGRGQHECSHSSGRYRFLETRNLNAFLMWSRPNQASLSRNDSARDVCDVLESALLCLEGGSTEEP